MAGERTEILEQFTLDRRAEKLRTVAIQRTKSLTLVLDRFHHDHNISAVIRSAEAFGIQDVHIIGEALETNSAITQGTERWVDITTYSQSAEAIKALKDAGYKLALLQAESVALPNAQTQNVPITALPFQTQKLALVFGNEKKGICDSFLPHADFFAHIPMYGFVESLNVSVTVAICLFCSTLKNPTVERLLPPLTAAEQTELLDRWFSQDVRGAELILKRASQTKRSSTNT